MTIVHRKLAMLEKTINQREQEAQLQGYTYDAVDKDFRNRLTALLDQVRSVY